MASPPILDLDTLLAPIAGDNPAGGTLPHDVRQKLDESRKEINPNQFARNDPRRPDLLARPQLAYTLSEPLAQQRAKRHAIRIAYLFGDPIHAVIAGFQQVNGTLDPQILNVFDGGLAEHCIETS